MSGLAKATTKKESMKNNGPFACSKGEGRVDFAVNCQQHVCMYVHIESCNLISTIRTETEEKRLSEFASI